MEDRDVVETVLLSRRRLVYSNLEKCLAQRQVKGETIALNGSQRSVFKRVLECYLPTNDDEINFKLLANLQVMFLILGTDNLRCDLHHRAPGRRSHAR